MRRLLTALSLFVALGSFSIASAAEMSPNEFVAKASASNQFEIEAATLANEKALHPETRQFAESMLEDHGKAGSELAEAAKQEGVAVPTEMPTEFKEKIDALKAAAPGEFDQAYQSSQVAAHEEAVALFSAYSKQGKDGALKTFAFKTLPTLHTHEVRIHGLTRD